MEIYMPQKYIGRHLMVKSKFINAILSGKKRATIRSGRLKVKSKEFYIHAGGKIIAKASVKKVVYKKIANLADKDAILDGLGSKEELLKELKTLYGEIRDTDDVTIIEFEILEKLNEPEDSYMKNLRPHELAKIILKRFDISEEERKILEVLVKTKSIRKTARRIFGNIANRWKIRKILKKYASLINNSIIGE